MQSPFLAKAGRLLHSLILAVLLWAASVDIVQAESPEKLFFYTQDFRPFHYTYGGKPAGPVVDLVRLVCLRLSVECAIEVAPWTLAQEQVREGKVHALFVVGRNDERESWLHFSKPVLTSEYGFFSRNEDPFHYTQPKDLSGKRVGVYGPSNTEQSLRLLLYRMQQLALEPFEIVIFSDDRAAFQELVRGSLDAVYSNKLVGISLLASGPESDITFTSKHRDVVYYFGFSKELVSMDMVDRFNQGMEEVLRSAQGIGLLRRLRVTKGP